MAACERLELVRSTVPDAPIFWYRDEPISRAQFSAAAASLAARLPARRYAINLCRTRAAFSCAFAAAIWRGQTNLLPATAGSEAIAELQRLYPGAYRISEDPELADVCITSTEIAATDAGQAGVGAIRADHPAAIVFTSGSTGAPQPHVKTWRALHGAAVRLSARFLGASGVIAATVPQHHMYGLECTVVLPLISSFAVRGERLSFPQDIRKTLLASAQRCVLVTTPVHIRAILDAGSGFPALFAILSATARLPEALAARAETQFQAPVMEIYGCTEAGSLATRRTLDGQRWQLLQGVSLHVDSAQVRVSAEHLDGAIDLHDELEGDGADGFYLRGRTSDLVKVGGKRASLADLTQKLLSIPGVIDGVIFEPLESDPANVVARPAALVVAPGLRETDILVALGRLIDPVFLPRPLRRVAALPRNDVGKLPKSALHQLLTNA